MFRNIVILLIVALSIFSCRSAKIDLTQNSVKGYDTASFDYLYIEGIKMKTLGDAGEALKYFEKALTINPHSDAAYFEIAQIISRLGDNNKAISYALMAYKLDAENEWYLSLLASLYQEGGNKDSASVYLSKVLKLHPEKESIRYSLASLYAETGRFTEAEELLLWFEEKYGTNETTTLVLIRSLMNAGKFSEAEEKVKKLLMLKPNEIFYNGLLAELYRSQNLDREAIEVYNKLLEIDPENSQTLLSIADFFFAKADFRNFFSILGKIFMKDEISRDDKVQIGARLIENSDTLKVWRKDVELNLMILEAAYKNDMFIPVLRPEFLSRIGEKERAVAVLREVLKNNTGNYIAAETLMLIHAADNNSKAMVDDGKVFSTMFNRSFLIKIIYAQGALEMKMFDEALEELRKAEILAGDNNEFKIQVLAIRADLFYRKGDSDKAFATFDEALKISPDDATILNNYAYYLAEKNQLPQKSVEMAEKAISKERNNTYLDTYAWALFKAGKLKQALKIMEEIFNAGGSDAEYFEHYGFMLEKAGKCKEAVVSWTKALDLDGKKEHLLEKIKGCKD